MTLKIINMADRLKDREDLKLEALFRSEAVRDDGFSARIESRVRRQIWVQRLALPVAILAGVLFAAEPFFKFLEFVPQLLSILPQRLSVTVELPFESMPQLSTIVIGSVLLAVAMCVGRLLED